MKAVVSSDFLREFTIFADHVNGKEDAYVIQRANDKNVVLLSLDTYNELQKKIFLLQQKASE